jgi:hypothetical protein
LFLAATGGKKPAIINYSHVDTKLVCDYQVSVELLVHKIHVNFSKLKFFAQGNYSDHVPLQNSRFALLILEMAVRHESILRVDVYYFVSAALNHLLPTRLPRGNLFKTFTSWLAVVLRLWRQNCCTSLRNRFFLFFCTHCIV